MRIAVVGPAGSGKSTTCRALAHHWGGHLLSFAEPVKWLCHDLYGARMDDPVFRRQALQTVGVAARSVDPDVWVRKLERRLVLHSPVEFVDDCRFENEAVMLKMHGFYFVRLVATPSLLKRRRPEMTDEQRAHESEHGLDNFKADLELKAGLSRKEILNRINTFWMEKQRREYAHVMREAA